MPFPNISLCASVTVSISIIYFVIPAGIHIRAFQPGVGLPKSRSGGKKSAMQAALDASADSNVAWVEVYCQEEVRACMYVYVSYILHNEESYTRGDK